MDDLQCSRRHSRPKVCGVRSLQVLCMAANTSFSWSRSHLPSFLPSSFLPSFLPSLPSLPFPSLFVFLFAVVLRRSLTLLHTLLHQFPPLRGHSSSSSSSSLTPHCLCLACGGSERANEASERLWRALYRRHAAAPSRRASDPMSYGEGIGRSGEGKKKFPTCRSRECRGHLWRWWCLPRVVDDSGISVTMLDRRFVCMYYSQSRMPSSSPATSPCFHSRADRRLWLRWPWPWHPVWARAERSRPSVRPSASVRQVVFGPVPPSAHCLIRSARSLDCADGRGRRLIWHSSASLFLPSPFLYHSHVTSITLPPHGRTGAGGEAGGKAGGRATTFTCLPSAE